MRVDVVIVGNGPTGRLAQRALSALGLDTVVVAPAGRPRRDPRTIALLPGTVASLERLGVDVRPHATVLPELVIQTMGPFGLSAERFSAAEIGEPYLALNVPIARLAELMPVADAVEAAVSGLNRAHGRAAISSADGTRIEARLVVAADGASSPTREAAGIRMYRRSLGLSALCAPVALGSDHGGVCIERYDDVGSVTFISVGTRDGSLITIAPTQAVERLADAGPESIAASVAERQPAYGSVRLAGEPALFGLSIGWSPSPGRQRVVAVGEAAHTVPPIGAQGWNMAAADVIALRDAVAAAVQAGRDIGAADVLADYARRRRGDLAGRITAVGLLAGVATNHAGPARLARQIGLGVLSRLPGAKRRLMRNGLGRTAQGGRRPRPGKAPTKSRSDADI